MRFVVFSLVALFISLALFISGNVMLGTLISLRLDLEGINDTVMGIVLAFYSVGFVLGATFCVRIIREVGHIRAFAVFAAIACAASLLHPMWFNIYAWAVMRLLVGFSIAGLLTVTESWINDRATNETRGVILGFYTINVYVASTLGQVLVGVGNPMNYKVYSIVAMLLVLSLVPLALTRSMIPTAPSPTEFLKTSRLIRQAPAGVTGVLVAGIGLGGFVSLGPVYALRNGLEVGLLSKYMAFSVACAVILQWPAGWLSDRLGRLPVLVALLLMGALSAAATAAFSPTSLTLMFLFSGIFYAISASIYPVGLSLANDQFSKDMLVMASAALLRVYGVGTILGPLVGGFLMGMFAPSALFVFIALTMVVAGAAVHLVFRRWDEVSVEDQGEYAVVSPTSSTVIVELDPRNEEYEEHQPGEPAEWDLADKLEMLVIDAEVLAESEEQGRSVEGKVEQTPPVAAKETEDDGLLSDDKQ